ncbi:hypothetical protein [Acidisoma sp. 7E03]
MKSQWIEEEAMGKLWAKPGVAAATIGLCLAWGATGRAAQAESVTVPKSVAPAPPGPPGPAGPTPTTPPEIPPKSDGGSVITPPKSDTRMPVIKPAVPSRMPVIHPDSGAAPGGAQVVPK